DWLRVDLSRYRLQSSSYETRKTSGRVDRTFTFERVDRQIAGAPLRLDAMVAGNLPVSARTYVVIPESFARRYDEMRSANDFIAMLAAVAITGLAIAGMLALRRYSRQGLVRWREPLIVGAFIGGLLVASGLNEIPGSWFDYDTASSPTTFLAFGILSS